MISGNLLVTLGKARPPSEVVWNSEALTHLGKIDWSDFAGRMLYGIQQEGKHAYLTYA